MCMCVAKHRNAFNAALTQFLEFKESGFASSRLMKVIKLKADYLKGKAPVGRLAPAEPDSTSETETEGEESDRASSGPKRKSWI